MVADPIVYHPTVSHFLNFLATTVGRDKLLRTLQYLSRFWAWYLYRTNYSASTILPFENAKRQFGITRKILRVGKFLEHLRAAAHAAQAVAPLDPILRYCAVARQLSYATYLFLDSLTVLDAASIRPYMGAKRLQVEALKAWFAGLMFNLIAGVYTLHRLRQRSTSLDKSDGEAYIECKKLERDRRATAIQLISDLCDLTIPSSALGYCNFDDGIVGLAGTVSSLIGLNAVWRKTA